MKDRKKKELEWNAYYEDFNGKKIVPFNVFHHTRFNEDVKKSFKKNKNDFETFKKELKSNLMYYYWSKCEWEIILAAWISKNVPEIKIDVYDQVMLNFDLFAKYVWDFYSSRRKQTTKTNDKKQTTTKNSEPIMYPFNVVVWNKYPDTKPAIDGRYLVTTKRYVEDGNEDGVKLAVLIDTFELGYFWQAGVVAWAELPIAYDESKK